MKDLKSHFRESTDFPVESLIAPAFLPGPNFSDHWSFWMEGYLAVLVTDTAFLRSPHYHSKTDLPDTLDYERTAVMLHGLKEAVILFAN